jgi:hypothetical protein
MGSILVWVNWTEHVAAEYGPPSFVLDAKEWRGHGLLERDHGDAVQCVSHDACLSGGCASPHGSG